MGAIDPSVLQGALNPPRQQWEYVEVGSGKIKEQVKRGTTRISKFTNHGEGVPVSDLPPRGGVFGDQSTLS